METRDTAPTLTALRRRHPIVRRLPDAALLARARRGHEEALRELYDRYGRVAYGLALRILGDLRRAEAVVEDAFAAVLRANDSGADGASARTRILTLVHRSAVERLRELHPGERTAQAPDGRPASNGDGSRSPEQEHALNALAELPDEARELLMLAYFDGLTLSDLAERFDQPLNTVTAALTSAVGQLRDALVRQTAPIRASELPTETTPLPQPAGSLSLSLSRERERERELQSRPQGDTDLDRGQPA